MRNIALTISYDGTNFVGWQRQPDIEGRTVQCELEKALGLLHKTPVTVNGSGRTDSGVHAIGQVANFLSPIDSIPVEKYAYAINGFLPKDVRINAVSEKDDDFHARFSATSRSYRYFFHYGPVSPFAHEMNTVWWVRYKPNIDNLNEMAACLVGETDCASFASAGDLSLTTYRDIQKSHFFFENGKLVFEIQANAFLWKMVRTIVGTLIELDRKKHTKIDFQAIIDAKNRKNAAATAPATGLFLWNINFDGERKYP